MAGERGNWAASYLALSANTPWVYALARALSAHGRVTAVRIYDWRNYRRLKPQWPETASPVCRVTVAMPQGYAGRLEPVFRPLMRALVARERSRLRRQSNVEPIVICPYPYLAPWVRSVPSDSLIYYNLDEYTFYDPTRTQRILRQEGELVARAKLTVCLSVHQVETLRARNPAHSDRIHHFPLAVVEEFVNPAPERPPLPNSVGYVGNLTDRVDWAFVADVAERLPEATFHMVGGFGVHAAGGRNLEWREQRRRALSLHNVIYHGEVPQRQVREHYWRYAVNWMPYDVTHRFNIASCPTKIMDALAAGRPFISTKIPEVELYSDWLDVVQTPDQAASALRRLLCGAERRTSREQIAFAASQTWPDRARRTR